AKDAPTRARQWVRAGDVLVSMTRPNLNAVAQAHEDLDGAVASTGFDVLRPVVVLPEWVFYRVCTNEFVADVCEDLQGVVYPAIRPHDVRRHRLPLPPEGEQRRIVEAIESYFTRLDDAVATLERVQRNLKRYRASVLKAAVKGRLVPTEAKLARAVGRDYEPASVLLERILAERRRGWEEAELAKMKAKGKAPKDDKWKAKYTEPIALDRTDLPTIPEGWTWVRLGDVAELLNGDRGKNYPSRSAYVEKGVPFITATNLTHGRLDNSSLNFISEERFDLLRAGKIEDGDILYCLRGSLGKSAIVRHLARGAIASSLVIIRTPPLLDPRYIYAALASSWGLHLIDVHDNGTAQPNLSAKSVGDYAIPLPPVLELVRIADEVDRQISIVVQLERLMRFAESRSTQLRQSILKWAFEGRLVDQDPTDEPASRLLERIRAERESTNGNPRRRPRRLRARSLKP
ncbi:MAG TPA: restriction endonuclease subunit S, partial [Thermoanaerobaculia bacterium]|nr:restriction endonuclease subunit S [Thermoanaerobaculia bacterium]